MIKTRVVDPDPYESVLFLKAGSGSAIDGIAGSVCVRTYKSDADPQP
jgi:hypothetical protein